MKRLTIRLGVLVLVCLPLSAQAWEFGNLRLRGRLQTRFEVVEYGMGSTDAGDDGWVSRFKIRRARIDGRWEPSDWARLVLEFEGAGRLDLAGTQASETSWASQVELVDAFGRFEVDRALVFHVGQFKKPFSRLKMTSPFELFLPVRGLLNKNAIARTRHGGFGGREIGAMVSGRVKQWARLRYYLGVFSGPRIIDAVEDSHKDVVARLQVRPFKGLRVAVNATHKLYHFKEGVTLTNGPLTRGTQYTGNFFGADARYKIENFVLMVEGAYGDNVDLGPGHQQWGFHTILAYSIHLGDGWVITPAVMVELLDPSDDTDPLTGDDIGMVVRLAEAVNVDIGEGVRIVAFAENSWGDLLAFDSSGSDGGGGYSRERPPTRFFVQVNLSF